MTDDRDIQFPRNSGLVPVSGATDFSINPGTLKLFGDLRCKIVDYHTLKPVYYFKKPLTRLPSGAFTINFDDYYFVPPTWAPIIAPDGPLRVDERGGTVSIEAQEIDGVDREKRIISVVWPAAFNGTDDLDAVFTFYKRRCVWGSDAITLTLSEDGTVVDDTITYDLRLVYSVDPLGAPYTYNLSDLPIRVSPIAALSVLDSGKINPVSGVGLSVTNTSPFGVQLLTPLAAAALTFPVPILDDVEHLPVAVADAPNVPQTITGSTYTSPADASEIMVPCVHTTVGLFDNVTTTGPFITMPDETYIVLGTTWSYANKLAIGLLAAPEDPDFPNDTASINVNGGLRTLSTSPTGIPFVELTEPVLGEMTATLRHGLHVVSNFLTIGEIYAGLADDFIMTESEKRDYAMQHGWPIGCKNGDYFVDTITSCSVDYPEDSQEYLLARVLTLGATGLIDAPYFGGIFQSLFGEGDDAFAETSNYGDVHSGVYRIYYPSIGITEYTIKNVAALDKPFSYEFDMVVLG